MLNFNPIETRITDQFRRLAGILILGVSIFYSCAEDSGLELTGSESDPALDVKFSEVSNDMDDNPELALEKLNDIVSKADLMNSKYYSGKAKFYMGYIYDEILEDVSQAYHSYNEALKDVLQTEDSSLKMKIYNNLGILYRFYRQYDAAIDNYESAIELKDDLSIEQLSNVYHNYGVALKLKGDSASFFKAEQAFTKSLEFAQQIDHHENIASVHNQIGLMYKAVENYEMARIAYNNTIRTYINNPELQDYVGKAYHGIGITYKDEKDVEAAVDAFEKALKYKRSSGSIFITKYDLGTVLLRGGQTEKAVSVWKDALTEKHDKNSVEQVQIYADLTAALNQNNQYEEALGYSEVYNANIKNILEEGEKYKNKSDQVLFANVVKEYDEFNKPIPFFSRPLVVLAMIILCMGLVYAMVRLYYSSRSQREVSKVISKIQTEFTELRVD